VRLKNGREGEQLRRIVAARLLDMNESQPRADYRVHELSERNVANPHATSNAFAKAGTFHVPFGSPIALMYDSPVTRILDERAYEARMRSDVDESTTTSKHARSFRKHRSNVVYVGVNECRSGGIKTAVGEREVRSIR